MIKIYYEGIIYLREQFKSLFLKHFDNKWKIINLPEKMIKFFISYNNVLTTKTYLCIFYIEKGRKFSIL